ncbi:hypothetical protein, partial [Enterobacter asburiae]
PPPPPPPPPVFSRRRRHPRSDRKSRGLVYFYKRQTQDDARFAEWVELVLDQSLLAERATLEDPNLLIKRVNALLLA